MSHAERTETLKLALDLDDTSAKALAQVTRKTSYDPNSVVYYQDDPASQFYILTKGTVRLCYIDEDGTVILLSIVTPKHCFGEACALAGLNHCETAFIQGFAEVLSFDRRILLNSLQHSTHLREALGQLVAKRHRSHMTLTRALYRPSLQIRLSHVLLWLLDELGTRISYKGHIVECLGPVVSQSDLGAMARGTRENVNKTLRKWKKLQIIALEDRHILVLDKLALQNIVQTAL